jgi:hypothetical protein
LFALWALLAIAASRAGWPYLALRPRRTLMALWAGGHSINQRLEGVELAAHLGGASDGAGGGVVGIERHDDSFQPRNARNARKGRTAGRSRDQTFRWIAFSERDFSASHGSSRSENVIHLGRKKIFRVIPCIPWFIAVIN